MVDITLLRKLAELKEHEVEEYQNDLNTLSNIVANLERKLQKHQSEMDEFANQVISDQSFNSNSAQMISGRLYLDSLSLERSDIEKSKLEAVTQKDSAFDVYKESVVELKKLTKLIEQLQFQAAQQSHKKSLVIDDELELYRFNSKV